MRHVVHICWLTRVREEGEASGVEQPGLCNLSEEVITALTKRCHPSSARKCEQVLMFDPVL